MGLCVMDLEIADFVNGHFGWCFRVAGRCLHCSHVQSILLIPDIYLPERDILRVCVIGNCYCGVRWSHPGRSSNLERELRGID